MALEHEHPVEAVALLAAGVGLQRVAVAGLQVLRVHCVHGARTKRLVRLNKTRIINSFYRKVRSSVLK